MSTFAPADLIAALRRRYATKIFDSARAIPEGLWDTLEESLVLTPSSFGLQPWKFIVIRDPALRGKLLPHSWNQKQIVDCSHLVVFARREKFGEAEVHRFVESIAAARGVEPGSLEGYKGVMSGFIAKHPDIDRWAANQVYIALGQFMTSCAVLGVDACPMEGISPAKYDEVLGLGADGYATVVTCAVGYRSPEDKYATLAKVRYPAHIVVDRR